MGCPGESLENQSAKRDSNSIYLFWKVSEGHTILNNLEAIFCYILPNNLTAFCLCLENFTEELKNSALIFLVEKVSRRFHIRLRHCSVLIHIYKKKKQGRCKMYSFVKKEAGVSLKLQLGQVQRSQP